MLLKVTQKQLAGVKSHVFKIILVIECIVWTSVKRSSGVCFGVQFCENEVLRIKCLVLLRCVQEVLKAIARPLYIRRPTQKIDLAIHFFSDATIWRASLLHGN